MIRKTLVATSGKGIKIIGGGIGFTCLFKSSWSLEANKDSLINSFLNGFNSFVKIGKSLNKPT